jgi:hypothetical protein
MRAVGHLVDDDDVGTLCGEAATHGLAHAPATARDDRSFRFEQSGHGARA